MCIGFIGIKTNPREIKSGSFPAVMIRRMVEVKTGDTSDAEYELAARETAKKLGLQYVGGKLNLTHVSVGTMEYISSQIADAVFAKRPEKAGAF